MGYLSWFNDWARGWTVWVSQKMCLFFKISGPALGPTKLPIQWVVGDFSKGVKPLTCEADHLPSSSVNINPYRTNVENRVSS